LTEKPNLSEALDGALDQLAGMLEGSGLHAQALLQSLRVAARIEALQSIEAPDELADAITQIGPVHVRRGAAFLTRPSWAMGRDLFSFDVFGAPQKGWYPPQSEDGELVRALERALHAYGEDQSGASGAAATEESKAALAHRLSTVNLSNEDVLIAVPPFLPEMRLIYVALSDPDGLQTAREGLFYGVLDDGGSEWLVESFDYTSPNLHKLNKKLGVKIAGNELCYLRYFLQVVRGEEGAFREIDQRLRDHIGQIMSDNMPAEDVEIPVDDLFSGWHPLRCAGAWHSGGLKYDAWLLYGGGIFQARFVVFGNGAVSMISDEPVAGPYSFLREQ
jgi:hypothetical protein